ERCLDRDRHHRLRDIGEARIILEKAEMRDGDRIPNDRNSVSVPHLRALPWAVTLVAIVFAVATAWVLWPRAVEPPSAIRLRADVGADTSVTPGSSVSLSPDGKALAFVAGKTASDKPQIYLRKLDQLRGSPM